MSRSIEAIEGTLNKPSNNEVSVPDFALGGRPDLGIDITLAKASNALIIGFNVRAILRPAIWRVVTGLTFATIRLFTMWADDVKKGLEGPLSPELREKILGYAEIRSALQHHRRRQGGRLHDHRRHGQTGCQSASAA